MTLENNQLRMDFSVTFECNPDTNVISYSFNQDGNSTLFQKRNTTNT